MRLFTADLQGFNDALTASKLIACVTNWECAARSGSERPGQARTGTLLLYRLVCIEQVLRKVAGALTEKKPSSRVAICLNHDAIIQRRLLFALYNDQLRPSNARQLPVCQRTGA